MPIPSGAIEREYDAHLAARADRRAELLAEHGPTECIGKHDAEVTEFMLAAGPVLARAAQGGDQQGLYEELARLTCNDEALRRIEEARLRRDDSIRAVHRPRNKRKTRERALSWSGQDLVCAPCGVSLLMLPKEAAVVCPQCGAHSQFQETTADALPFGERPPISQSSYSRHNHMQELLAQVQGLEHTEVPQDVVDRLRKQLRKHRLLDDPARITPAVVKAHLKQIKLSKWYDNAMQLALIVTGGRCPRLVLPPDLVRDIHASFAEAQEPFDLAIQDAKRTNFLAYSASLYQARTPSTRNPSSSTTLHRCVHRLPSYRHMALSADSSSTKHLSAASPPTMRHTTNSIFAHAHTHARIRMD
ncbi:hypothetical protein WJX74_006453 [Apatococcus lobatus]|uniref:Uncharacterized protein n=1 Tax=Apatococcus lobatus TaxID=904363 RepID=A0AAW1PR25_9CHLO